MRRLLFIACGLFAACNCGDTTKRVTPSAGLSVPGTCAHAPPDLFSPCAQFHDTRGDTASAPLSFGVQSIGSAKLTVKTVSITGDDKAFFTTAEQGGKVLAGGQTLSVPVVFAPKFTLNDPFHPWTSATRDEWYFARLDVETDDPKHPALSAALVGHGVEPVITAAPASFDFGAVLLGQSSATQNLQIGNAGTHPPGAPNDTAAALHISDAHVEPTPAQFFSDPPIAPPAIPGGNSQGPYALYFKPSVSGVAQGTLVILSDDPVTPRLEVPLLGSAAANQPPIACLGVARVLDHFGHDKVPVDGGFPVAPFDRVYLTAHPASEGAAPAQQSCGQDTQDPDSPDGGVAIAWGTLSAPAGSAAIASAQDDVTGATLPAWQREVHVDLEGAYGEGLTATDSLNASTQTSLGFTAQRRGISVELTWPQVGADLDVHLVRPPFPNEYGDGGVPLDRACTCDDCFWGDCKLKTTGQPPLDWGPNGPDDSPDAGFVFADDPLLDRDSTGNAPLSEAITADAPYTGDYEVYVHYFAWTGSGTPIPADATVTIWADTTQVATTPLTLPAPNGNTTTLWHVGTLHWNGAGTTFTIASGTPTVTVNIGSGGRCNSYFTACQ